MDTVGIVRRVDELGRITLPIELRRTLEIDEKDQVEILSDADCIIIKKYQASCIFCGSKKANALFNGKYVCKTCRVALKKVK